MSEQTPQGRQPERMADAGSALRGQLEHEQAAGDPASPATAPATASEAERTPEEERDTDRSTVWYTLGTGDMRILRMTLMEQNVGTLNEWRADAEILIEEIRRMLVWQQSVGSDRGSTAKTQPRPADRGVPMARETDDKHLDD
jgi:hypothetical protein